MFVRVRPRCVSKSVSTRLPLQPFCLLFQMVRQNRGGTYHPALGRPRDPPLGTRTDGGACFGRLRPDESETPRWSAERRAPLRHWGAETPRKRPRRAASWHANGAVRTRASASRRSAPSQGRTSEAVVRMRQANPGGGGMSAKPGPQRSRDAVERPPGRAERGLVVIVNMKHPRPG